jgi:hypothetical protein
VLVACGGGGGETDVEYVSGGDGTEGSVGWRGGDGMGDEG